MLQIVEKVYGRLRVLAFRMSGVTIRGRLGLRYGVDIPRLAQKIYFGDRVNLDRGVSIVLTKTEENNSTPHLLLLGNQVYINRFTVIDATSSIQIGDRTMIGTHCYITDHDHVFQGQPVDRSIGELPLTGVPTSIEENVWIGSHVTILKGVTIGKNSIIGAGSVVTKSIPANSVAVGNPCRVIRERK